MGKSNSKEKGDEDKKGEATDGSARQFFNRNFHFWTQKLELEYSGLLERLVPHVLTQHEVSNIKSTNNVEALIEILQKKDDAALQKFQQALHETNQTHLLADSHCKEHMHEKLIDNNLVYLVKEINTKDLWWPTLIQNKVITRQVYQHIMNKRKTPMEQREALLCVLVKGSTETFERFVETLQETGQGHIVTKCFHQDLWQAGPSTSSGNSGEQMPTSPPSTTDTFVSSPLPIVHAHEEDDPEHVQILEENFSYLCKNIKLENSLLWDLLVTKSVLDQTSMENIKGSNPKETEQVSALLQQLCKSPSEKYEAFKEALIEANQENIAQFLGAQGGDQALKEIQHTLAQYYNRSLSAVPMAKLTNDRTLADVRKIYTRTQLTDIVHWPAKSDKIYECYHQLFDGSKTVLLIGDAGKGKSILSRKLALDWSDLQINSPDIASSDIQANGEKSFVQQFAIVFYIDMGRVKPRSTRENILMDQIGIRKHKARQILSYISKHEENCLIILDGWDESHRSTLPDIKRYTQDLYGSQKPYVLVTSRLLDNKKLPLGFKTTMIIGFSKEQAIEFINKVTSFTIREESKRKQLVKIATENQLWGLFSIPFMLTCLCMLNMEDQREFQITPTSILIEILQMIIQKKKGSNVLLYSIQKDLRTIGKFAFDCLSKGKVGKTTFDTSSVPSNVLEPAKELNLLQTVDPLSDNKTVSFVHQAIQEFLAAIYIVHGYFTFSKVEQFLTSMVIVYERQLFINFICGMSNEIGSKVLQLVLKLSQDSTSAIGCPKFSYYASTKENLDPADKAVLKVADGSDITPFIIECCTEFQQLNSQQQWIKSKMPLTSGKDFPRKCLSTQPSLKLPPILNFAYIPLRLAAELLDESFVEFENELFLRISNITVPSNESGVFSKFCKHIKCRKIKQFWLSSVKVIESNEKSILSMLQNCRQLAQVKFDRVNIPISEFEDILQLLKKTETLILLEMIEVNTFFKAESLVECVTECKRLHSLNLTNMELGECASKFTINKDTIEVLILNGTNLSGTAKNFPKCLNKCTNLKFLEAANCSLTEEQVYDLAIAVYSSRDSMVRLDISGSPLTNIVYHLGDLVKTMANLKELFASNCKLTSEGIVYLFKNMPGSTRLLNFSENSADKNILNLIPTLDLLTQLDCVLLSLESLDEASKHQMRNAFESKNIALVSTLEDEERNIDRITALLNHIYCDAMPHYLRNDLETI